MDYLDKLNKKHKKLLGKVYDVQKLIIEERWQRSRIGKAPEQWMIDMLKEGDRERFLASEAILDDDHISG